MPPFVQFVLRRALYALISLFIITMVLYGGVMLAPPEARAELYLPPGKGGERATANFIRAVIKNNHLDAPYYVQYGYWLGSLATGSWGYSPTLGEDVLPSLLRRTPATLELALYSMLLIVPLGLASGLRAGWRPRGSFDRVFRSLAFIGTSMPPFIFAMVLLTIFYVKLHWFQPGQIDSFNSLAGGPDAFSRYTGMLTVDGLLNGRPDAILAGLRRLAMPVMTLFIYHWATLGRITRATVMGERGREYITAAKARGVREPRLIWRHALAAILAPTMTTMALSAAAMVTGVFVVEVIYALNGVSEVIVVAMNSTPDATAALGFSVYSILMVICLMFGLDVLQAALDPRVRDEILKT